MAMSDPLLPVSVAQLDKIRHALVGKQQTRTVKSQRLSNISTTFPGKEAEKTVNTGTCSHPECLGKLCFIRYRF